VIRLHNGLSKKKKQNEGLGIYKIIILHDARGIWISKLLCESKCTYKNEKIKNNNDLDIIHSSL